jgi:pSer/pThr/pTyr-binding forkhead associated (FHA) protein
MNYPGSSDSLAKITWVDPTNNEKREYILVEGATASIGRSPDNDICIPERHVSRQHAVISFRDGIFVISDLGSANGTFINDKKLSDAFPLAHGDVIRLFVPVLNFSATATAEEAEVAKTTGRMIIPSTHQAPPRLMITSGPSEGQEFILAKEVTTVGRATSEANWDIILNDRAVSRPHCRFQRAGEGWAIMDLGSANGTLHNNEPVLGVPRPLHDGDIIIVGETTILFRQA